MKTKEREKLGKMAGEITRAKTLKEAKTVGLSVRKVLKVIVAGLGALENKVFYNKDIGQCVTGPDMINWKARLKAAEQATAILGLIPKEDAIDDVGDATPVSINIQVVDKSNKNKDIT